MRTVRCVDGLLAVVQYFKWLFGGLEWAWVRRSLVAICVRWQAELAGACAFSGVAFSIHEMDCRGAESSTSSIFEEACKEGSPVAVETAGSD